MLLNDLKIIIITFVNYYPGSGRFCNNWSRSLYYKTYYNHNLQIFIISQSVFPWQASPAQSNGSSLTRKHYTRLERLARDKHTSLLRKSVNQSRNKFYSTGPRLSTFLIFLNQQDELYKIHFLKGYLKISYGWMTLNSVLFKGSRF